MSFKTSSLCAASLLSCIALSTQAAIVKNAGHASTSNTTTSTTTSGQKSILMNIDPFSVASFNLDVSFEADKVQFVGITGLNGYQVDNFQVSTDGSTGLITDIHGFFPGFNDEDFSPIGIDSVSAADVTQDDVTNPPTGEVDIFQLTFLDLRPDLDKTFGVFAGPDGYITGFDPDTGDSTTANGPFNPQTGLGVDPAFSTVAGVSGGGSSAPLPPAVFVGLLGGMGVVANGIRRRRA
jgi:hypothetical protein